MDFTQNKELYNQFKDDRTSVDSEPRSSRPVTSLNDQVIAKVKALVMRDRPVTIRDIAGEEDISAFSAHSILTGDLTMKESDGEILALHSHLLGEKLDSCGSPGS
jgi:hypothetical protein